MTVRAIYITHPEVVINPDVAVTDWPLTEQGKNRVAALAARLVLPNSVQVIASAERKALETAWPLAMRAGCAVDVRPSMHENDRSATGYLPKDAFERMADAFFACPDQSAKGWETARAAQNRIVSQVKSAIADFPGQDLIFTGHGAVGTLLYCHLSGHSIDRKWDQTGGGHWFAFDPVSLRAEDHWQPIETLSAL